MYQTNDKSPGSLEVSLKLYARDNVNAGFWMAICNDNWKTACVEKDDFEEKYFIKVHV